MHRLLVSLVAALSFLSAGHCLAADDFPTPHNAGAGSDGQPLGSEQAAAAFELPPGFKAQVFAAEPDVQNPVAMTWDNRGRLWVAECYTYANRPTRYDLALRDRVIILADKDGDGRADERKVFCDNVQQLTSVEVGLGGVWLLALPRLLFIPDHNGDDIPDAEPQVVLDGFEINSDNYHNCANGLRWGLDGWLYGRCGASSPGLIGPPGMPREERTPIYGGIWRYHPGHRIFEVLCHGFTNPWGHDWDEYGEMFVTNTVTGHLFHMIPGAHYSRSSTLSPNRYVYEPIDSHADHFHYDTGRGWKESLKDHTVDDLGGGHAHCGACIYLGDNWPVEYRGKLLTLNLHGRRINVDRLERAGSGYVARHEPDIAKSADPWFRGIDLNYGPDGAVYIIDWSDTGDCHEHDGIHRLSGRVYRISYGDAAAAPIDLTKLSPAKLADLHEHSSEWFVRHARQELGERTAPWRRISQLDAAEYTDAIQRFERVLSSREATTKIRLRALWTLRSLNAFTDERKTLLGLLDEPDEHLRVWGLRLLTDFWRQDTVLGEPREAIAPDEDFLARLEQLAKNDRSALVRLTLASTLQRLPLRNRFTLAAQLLSHAADGDDHNLPKLVFYGLIPALGFDADLLIPLISEGKLPLTRQWLTRAIAENPKRNWVPIDDLLKASLAGPEEVRVNIVAGLSAGLAGHPKAVTPESWKAFEASLKNATLEVQDQVRRLSVIFGDGQALDEVKKVALDDKAKVPERRLALETLLAARPDDLRQICERLLRVRFLNMTAMKGLTLFDDPELGQQLARSYGSFHPSERPAVIETLVSRLAFAAALLDQIAAGRIPVAAVSALQARQIRSFGDETLSARLAEVWGELRDSPTEKQQLIEQLQKQLTQPELAKADPHAGRAVFQTTCAACHRLFGAGGAIGPDLTGSGRHNLAYLLENIVDPSAVVNKDFRMSVLRLADGRVLNGLIVSQDASRVVVQTAKELITLLRSEIDAIQLTTLSPMPEGMLQPLGPAQVRDLVAYLMSPSQVELPAEQAAGDDK